MDTSFASAVVILLLVMDPIGNIPLFVSLLRNVEPRRRVRVIVRECLIAFAVLIVFAFFGKSILDLFGMPTLRTTPRVIRSVALRMIFRGPEGYWRQPEAKPFIVPPRLRDRGPAAIATIVLLVSSSPQRLPEWVAAVSVAMLATLTLLIVAGRISKLVGERGLLAFERLMGLILTAIAVEMLLRGISAFVRQL